jgi:hypothetical protein
MYKRLNIGDDIDTANCLINIGIVCFNLKFQEMALKYSLEGSIKINCIISFVGKFILYILKRNRHVS